MAKDKRSRRDKLKDGIIDNIHKRIEQIEAINKEKQAEIDMDNQMVVILRQQIQDIDAMCAKQDETNKAKKSDGKMRQG